MSLRLASAEPAEAPSGGLLSRLTSRQLLRRATGGRAESFSPEAEEAEDASDLPLEPGTDSPLDSSLTGAPSSDTEFMSGGRKGRAARISRRRGHDDEPPIVDDDFLAAARRAARAAAAEADGPDVEAADAPYDEVAAEDQRVAGARRNCRRAHRRCVGYRGRADGAQRGLARPTDRSFLEGQGPVDRAGNTGTADGSGAAGRIACGVRAEEESPSPAATAAETPPMPSEGSELTAAPEAPTRARLRPRPQRRRRSCVRKTPAVPARRLRRHPLRLRPSLRRRRRRRQPRPPRSHRLRQDRRLPPASSPSGETPAAATLPEFDRTRQPSRSRPRRRPDSRVRDWRALCRGPRRAGGHAVAVAWYEKSAEAGLAPAQYRLGSIYEKGLGVPHDMAKAQEWYGRAADAGNVKAMHNLAVLYAEGAGGAPDLERASALFRQAAEHGVRDSQFNLAILHARGLGVPQDLVEAYNGSRSPRAPVTRNRPSGATSSARLSPTPIAPRRRASGGDVPAAPAGFRGERSPHARQWLAADGGSTSVEVKSDQRAGRACAEAPRR